MSSSDQTGGININQARDVTLQASGDIIAGNKTTINNIIQRIAKELTTTPYKFLASYDMADRDIFYGRDPIIEELAAQVGRHRVILINGASGSGKSSLVNAGLIPRVADNGHSFIAFREYNDPLAQLHEQLSAGAVGGAEYPPDEPRSLLRLIRAFNAFPLVIVFDQFERFFIRVDARTRHTFISAFKHCLQNSEARDLCFVLVFRREFLGQLMTEFEEQMPEFLNESYRINLLPLRKAEAREAILRPLEQTSLKIGYQPEFVDDVLLAGLAEQTNGGDSIDPPHLQIVCNELFETARQRLQTSGIVLIDQRLYDELGGAQSILNTYLDRVVESVAQDPERVAVVHSILKTMVDAGTNTRTFIALEGFRRNLPDVNESEILRFIEKLLEARVVEDRMLQFSLSHEHMVGKVKEWFDPRELERKRAEETLSRGMAEWTNSGALLGRIQVERIWKWIPELTVDERTFLQASEQKYLEEERKEASAKKLKRLSMYGAGAFTVLVILLGVYSWYQKLEAQAANETVGVVQRLGRHTNDIGTSAQRSLLLSVYAASLSKDRREGTLTAIDGLRQQLRTIGGRPLRGHKMAIRTATFSPDQRWLATGSEDGAIRLWDLSPVDPTSRVLALDAHKGPVHGLAFSADGRWLISGAADGQVRLWRLTTEGATADRVFDEGRYGAIQSLALSPNGDWLVFGTQGGNVCIWKMSVDGPREEPCEAWKDDVPVMQVLFSSKGRWLATSCTGACKSFGAPVRLWDLSAGFSRKEPRRLSHATALVEDSLLAIAFNAAETRLAVAYGYVAEVWDLTQENPPQHVLGRYSSSGGWIGTLGLSLSPDNHWLAIGSGSGSNVLLWDLTGSRKEPIALKGHSAAVNSVVFSEDSRWLATGSTDATARLWDLADPTLPSALLRGQDSPVTKVVFSPGSTPSYLVTVGEKPDARLWNVPDPLVDPVVMHGQVKPTIIGMAVSSDGNWIATSSVGDSKLVLWSARDPRQPQRELPIPSPSHAIAFSRDGRWLAAKSQDKGVITLWSLADLSKSPLNLFENEWGDVRTLRFSPDNRWLVSGTHGGIVNIWDVSGERPALEPRHRCRQGEGVREPAFSADGRFLATAAQGVSARLWDLASPDPCAGPRILPHGNVVYQVVFSPDSRWAATASFDQKGRLWDLGAGSEPKLIAEPTFKDRVLQAAFSPDNRWVAFGSWDQTLQLLELRNPGASKQIELIGHAGRIASVSFSPDGRWLVSASEDGTIRLWDPLDPSAASVVLRGHEASVQHVGFSQDSRWVITGAYDGTVRQWRLKLDDLVELACQTAGRDLTPAEARTFLGDERAQQPCTH